MNTSELISAVAKSSGQTKDVAKRVIESLCEEVIQQVRLGSAVKVTGFGEFAPKLNPARTGRNPATGETVQIAESQTMKFKASKPVKDRLSKR